MPAEPFWAIVSRIACRQRGLVTRRQLLGAGAHPDAIAAARRSGRLVTVARAVYLVAGAPLDADTRLLATVLSAGSGAMLSHRSAAWLWRLVDRCPTHHEISVPRGRRPRTPSLVVHESTDLDVVVPGTIRGLPVTDVGRTVLDCGGLGMDLDLLIDAARREHQISRTLLPWTVAQHRRSGRRGIKALRAHLEREALPASDFERLACRWLTAHGVDGWVLHHQLVVPGHGGAELDLAWPDRKVALELEGALHGEERIVHDRDTRRQNRIVNAGWNVLRLTYRRWLREPDAALQEIVDAIS